MDLLDGTRWMGGGTQRVNQNAGTVKVPIEVRVTPDYNGQLTLRTWMSQPGQNYEGGKLAAAPDARVGVSKVRGRSRCRCWGCWMNALDGFALCTRDRSSESGACLTPDRTAPHDPTRPTGPDGRHRRALPAAAGGARPELQPGPLVHADAPPRVGHHRRGAARRHEAGTKQQQPTV